MNFIGVTLFYPEKDAIKYIKQMSIKFMETTIIVFDNTNSKNDNKNNFVEDNIIYIGEGINYGLSIAFNKMIDRAKNLIRKRGNTEKNYLFLLDQDSQFDLNRLDDFFDIAYKEINSSIAIYSCRTIPENEDYFKTEYITNRDWVISSGSILNLDIIIKNDIRYDENIFIDYVDYDFCNSCKRNFGILTCNDFVFVQKLGYLYKNNWCHSPIRFYYMMRDQLYLDRKYSKGVRKYYHYIISIKKQFIIVMTKEDKKLKKIYYIVCGVFDYFFNKCGEYKRTKKRIKAI